MSPYFREISVSPLSLKITSLLQSKHPCVVARSADFSVPRDPIYYPHRFHKYTQIVHKENLLAYICWLLIIFILFGQKNLWKYWCLIEIIEWGFCSDDRLANEHAGQRQLWRHDGYLLYFDDRLANEHHGHNDYDAMLYYLLYFVRKLIGSGVINSDLTANQNDRYMKLRYSVQVGEFPCYKWQFISL